MGSKETRVVVVWLGKETLVKAKVRRGEVSLS